MDPTKANVIDVARGEAFPHNSEFAERVICDQTSALGIVGHIIEAMLEEIGYPCSDPKTVSPRNIRKAMFIDETLKRRKAEHEG